jgi:molybdopterin biosynthesis enzyme
MEIIVQEKGGSTMIKYAVILPTGDEIRSGIVQDTDSSEAMRLLVKLNPEIEVTRKSPINDDEQSIKKAVEEAGKYADLVVLIGGSGGGHRYSDTLSKDFTHTALENVLEKSVNSQLFGKNGHLWCKLVCGYINNTLVVNLPGPFVEAKAAMEAFCMSVKSNDIEVINKAMAEAVLKQYPAGAVIK